MKTTPSEVRMTCKDVKELNELHWKATLHRCVREFGKSRRDIQKDKKSADWKCVAALVLKETTSAPNHWIAKQLTMGTPKSMSNAVYIAKRDQKKRNASLQLRQIIEI